MKKSILLLSALVSFTSFAQVGIDTETPKATLDVVGKPSQVDKVDGIIAPRITGDQLKVKTGYGLPQEGTLIYVTAAATGTPAGQTVNVTSPGYYYFDGAVWVKQLSGVLPSSGGSGTVTNFSAGDLSPLFTTTEATTTTTPALSFTLTNAGANTFFGNTTGSATAPSYNTASNLSSVAGSASATSPVTISGGNNALVNVAGATVAVNNTAPLWNANQLNGNSVANTTPTNGQVLTYNGTSWVPSTVATASVDWHVIGNADSEISTATETLDAAVVSTNYLGTKGLTDDLVIATAGKTHAVIDVTGTFTGGGNDASSLSWGKGNILDTNTNTIALGRDNTASGDFSMAIGRNNSATSTAAIAIGGQAVTGAGAGTIIPNTNSGTYSSSIGFGNTVSGNKNQVFGIRNIVSAANTAINFLGGTNVIGNDNEINSRNSVIIGNTNKTDVAASGTPNSVIVVGNSNGNSSKLGGFILGSSNNTSTGYVFGAGNTNTTTSTSVSNTMVIGFDFNNTTMAERTNSYANNQHYFAPSNAAKTNVGINTNPNTLTATQLESDLTVNTQIRILPQAAATTCNSTTLGAIRFNSSTSKHEGCGNGGAGNPAWQPLY
ncbi:beta strand repeat-containing protein [Chryseobacterium aquaticum]|uniref:Trimeric autotransporter adhesin YadA-like head domain-containing protein n=1 Tax=Chryseobacterium aquaticum subsp. greenlandense TaxID=345663 RepID=A0A124F2F9_9FLAO|nr:hypothetical protein [Chryseobacterium aquaticum]KUJ54631.1 hypothetical protein AR686_17120 [Chryseobacterium aquaticum subsp. greenlandense]